MTIIVEDGTGLSNSVSYGSVANADAYFVGIGNASWAALTTNQKETALTNATNYIDIRWDSSLPGRLLLTTQSLSFPRLVAGVAFYPVKLQRATFEYAVRAAISPLAPDLAYDDTNRFLSRKLQEVGPIKEDVSFTARSAFPAQWRSYPLPDGIMQTFITSYLGTVIRA